MHEFGLTGGIGSGKSTVAAGLVARGARLIDADAIVRDLQVPGAPVFVAMIEHFGDSIVAPDGTLDRAAVADIVFHDEAELDALNKLVHPAVVEEMKAQRAALETTDALVVTDIPLLVRADGKQKRRKEYERLLGVIVVDCQPDVAVTRLVEGRGFGEADARARIAAQASRDDRLAVADHVVDNTGDLAALEPRLDACWAWMVETAARAERRSASTR